MQLKQLTDRPLPPPPIGHPGNGNGKPPSEFENSANGNGGGNSAIFAARRNIALEMASAQKVRHLEKNLAFLKEEHERMLRDLRTEIEKLKGRNKGQQPKSLQFGLFYGIGEFASLSICLKKDHEKVSLLGAQKVF